LSIFEVDIAATLEMGLIGTGLIVLHFAKKEKSKLMKAGAFIMIVGGVLSLLCTMTYAYKYRQFGLFDLAAMVTSDVEVDKNGTVHHYAPEHP
jgi:hypothetical protein